MSVLVISSIVVVTLLILSILFKLDNQKDRITSLQTTVDILQEEHRKIAVDLIREKRRKTEKKEETKKKEEPAKVKNNVVPLHDYRNLNSVPASLANSYTKETVNWVNGIIDAMHAEKVGQSGGKEEAVVWGKEFKDVLRNDSPVKELANKINIDFDYDPGMHMGGIYPLRK